MSTKVRHIFIIVFAGMTILIGALANPGRVVAQTMTPYAPDACEDGQQESGAVYRICLPDNWNGKKLAVYAHGYVSPEEPVGIPEDQIRPPGFDQSIDEILNFLGYAFAMSSYSVNGLAINEGMADSLDVIDIFEEKHGTPDEVIIIGVSEGGLIAALSVEQHPQTYRGGLALCGPYGDFRGQIDYFGDFRILFDYFFPAAMPPTPVDIPQSLLDTWETSYYTSTIHPLIADPANAGKVSQLLTTTNAPFDVNNEAITKEQTIHNLLWYNVHATNDARAKLGGQPFDNRSRTYSGSDDDAALNQGVARFDADQAALDAVATGCETTGLLHSPLVTVHTDGDEVVPYWQAVKYGEKVAAQGSQSLYRHITVEETYGHCRFNTPALLSAFGALNDLIAATPPYEPPAIYLPIVAR